LPSPGTAPRTSTPQRRHARLYRHATYKISEPDTSLRSPGSGLHSESRITENGRALPELYPVEVRGRRGKREAWGPGDIGRWSSQFWSYRADIRNALRPIAEHYAVQRSLAFYHSVSRYCALFATARPWSSPLRRRHESDVSQAVARRVSNRFASAKALSNRLWKGFQPLDFGRIPCSRCPAIRRYAPRRRGGEFPLSPPLYRGIPVKALSKGH
jgi:hypothetical protein